MLHIRIGPHTQSFIKKGFLHMLHLLLLLQVAGTSSHGKRKDPKLIEKKQQVCWQAS